MHTRDTAETLCSVCTLRSISSHASTPVCTSVHPRSDPPAGRRRGAQIRDALTRRTALESDVRRHNTHIRPLTAPFTQIIVRRTAACYERAAIPGCD